MQRLSVLAVALVLTSVAGRASGDDKVACVEAADRGQALRVAHKLIEARAQFDICASRTCPTAVQSDCGPWLESTGRAIPTIVLGARTSTGADLVDVNVLIDGQPFATKLDGDAVPINPGVHVVKFTAQDGTSVEQQVVLREGEQLRPVAIVFPPRPTAAVAAPIPVPPAATESSAGPWRTVGWVAGAVGLAGLGAGAVFGGLALSDSNSAHCNAANQCQAGPLGDARTAAHGADIGLIAGGVLLAAGVTLVVWAPGAPGSAPEKTAALLRVSPMVGTPGVLLGGAF